MKKISMFVCSLVSPLLVFLTLAAVANADEPKAAPFQFVQICDTQLGFGVDGYERDLEKFRQAVRQINAMKPAFVVICGDLVNKPEPQAFADFKKVKDQFEVPCYCVAGNHDLGHPATAESLARFRELIGKDYYSFKHQNCTFVVVDTEFWKAPVEGESEAHDQWFEKTLKEAKAQASPVFVMGHHPLFLKTADEKEEYFNIPPEKRSQVLHLLLDNGAVAVLTGHTHRLVENEFEGIQFLSGEATSKNFDKRPFGYRVWEVDEAGKASYRFAALEE